MTRENKIIFRSALVELEPGQPVWQSNVALSIAEGVITGIEPGAPENNGGQFIDGVALPGMANVHSHAFQRGFAGLSEFRTSTHDSFWTWRNLMYDFVHRLTPEDVFIIARQLYLEMLAAGYLWVGEFHYLHNSENGSVYSNLAEMVDPLLRAAKESGIGICLLPVLYQRSGFNSETADESQRRFVLTDDQYCRLLEICKSESTQNSDVSVGLAIHSLRAVGAEAIGAVLDFRDSSLSGCPVHIHVAEQIGEIEECQAATGKRSIEYLCSRFDLDADWCLIHATHLESAEIEAIVNSGATVGLCPTTEANLGDGYFPASAFIESGGRIAIGSDSHCSVDLRDELRTLEYGQRLQLRQRAVLGTSSESVGRRLYRKCVEGGGQAIGVETGKIAVGYRADLIVVDDRHPTIAGAESDRLLDRLVFTNAGNPISSRMVGGTWIEQDDLASKFAKSNRAFTQLNKRLLS